MPLIDRLMSWCPSTRLLLLTAPILGLPTMSVAAPAIMQFPMRTGVAGLPSMTVDHFVHCLQHGPIPLRLADVSGFPDGRILFRLDNDLQQDEFTFRREKATARLVKLRRTNGATLTASVDLKRFVDRVCRQAHIPPEWTVD